MKEGVIVLKMSCSVFWSKGYWGFKESCGLKMREVIVLK